MSGQDDPPAALRRAWHELDALNERFYRRHAASFSRTRQRAWPGWSTVLTLASERLAALPGEGVRLLDVACGNARLLDALPAPAAGGARWTYVGVERSLPLLAAARRRIGELGQPTPTEPRHALLAADLLRADEWPLVAGERRCFDLVVAFGLLHHVPGRVQRDELLRRAGDLVRPGGLVAVSFWQFLALPALRARRIDPAVAVDLGAISRATAERLEPGDALLPWGDTETREGVAGPLPREADAIRFCHSASDEEIDALLDGSFPAPIWSPVARFSSDGRSGTLNAYAMLQRAP
ncbi:MAG: class I SAM-dependent methyltransferase [Acidobacteria bacterium]|nr:MAG: class I SAM-dependent methyltransferase [Acidobacteriota bacterium]REK08414.1 MAG: class I SAM-dependent methyltransferase [Acidobacteriota bacterium]